MRCQAKDRNESEYESVEDWEAKLIAVVGSRDVAHRDDQQQRRHDWSRPSGAQRHAKRSGNPNYIGLAEDAQIRAEIIRRV